MTGGWTRRGVLAGLGAVAATASLPRRAAAFGASSRVDIAELDLGPGTTSRPQAWRRLLYDMTQFTSVECESRSVVVKPDEDALFEHPFLVLLGTGSFEDPGEAATKQLEQYLAYGGFLFIDDTTADDASGFDRSVRRLISRVFPTRPMAAIAPDHPINRSFFLLRGCAGRVATHPHLESVTVGSLAPVAYCRNDISGALDRRPDGGPVAACVPGGESQRVEAMKLMINSLMYSLTADYKGDQVHIRQLMLEKRLR